MNAPEDARGGDGTDRVDDVEWLDDAEQAAWRTFLAMDHELFRFLDRRLQARSGISRGDFAVLVHLSEATDCTVRPSDLCRALGWEQSRMSHQLSRMERRGLLTRSRCTEDGRGAVVEVTEAGLATIAGAAPGHVGDLREVFVDVLGAGGLDQLAELSRRVLDAIRGEPLGTGSPGSVLAPDGEAGGDDAVDLAGQASQSSGR